MKSVLLFIFFIVAFSLTAKPQATGNYQLTVFGTRNGLLSPKIYTLLQASDHQLWIGTEIGASRYNGYTFQNLQYTTANEQVGKVVAITEDSAGGIWMGGEGGLFYFFNGELTRCVFVQNYVAAVESLTTDKNGAVWIGEMHGLYRLTRDEINKWRTNKKTLQLKPFGNIQQRIICLDADSGGNIYFGSFDGVFQLSGGNPTATRLWKNTDPSNLVRFITALSPDSLFFNQYNGESTSIIQGAISRYTAKDNVGHNFFRTGPSIYRLTTSTVERFQNGAFIPFINFGLQTNFAFDALCDAEGNIWVGTWEGLFKYRYNPFTIYQRKGTQHPETFSMLETGDGRVMFGGNRGTVHIKKGNEIVPLNEIKPPFGLAEVLAIYQHTDGSFWFGSGYQGITRLRNNSYTSFNESNGLPDNHCNTFFKVGEHTVFGCTEKGVIVLDPLAEQPVKGHYQFSKAYNRQPKLLGVFQPQPDRFLFYSNQGLFRLKDGMLYAEMIDGLPAQNLYITGIQQDKSGQIWIATQGKGLLQCRYGKNGLRLENQFTKRDGLLSDELLSVLVDRNNDLWIAGYTSLSLLKQNAGAARFINFTEKDGLPDAYYQHLHLVQQKDGTIWALNSMNLFSFHPDRILLNEIAPRLFFENVTLEKGANKTFATNREQLKLSHDENSLSFSFTGVSLTNPSEIKYAYRLMPGDTTWIETRDRKLYFNSLNPGRYTVEVKAANNSGLWSAPLQYRFDISPPFWNTWWFHSLAGLVLLLAIYWLFRRRIKTFKDKAAIEQQLAELESKALRAQMNPHFIFNSLNAIQELIVTQNVEAAYDYLSKFSKLLRLVLNHSEKPAIPLADELVMLQLYLELESLRFRKSFSYDIHTDAALDAESVLVPPLLLQPFIENAVWHGLMLKEGEKRIEMRIKQVDSQIVCTIEDNGIGRKRAGEIKAQKIGAQHFESKGLKLSRQRIELLETAGRKGTVEIEDLYESSLASGTRVSIHLPLVNS